MGCRAGLIGGHYRPLSIEQINSIHRATVDVLATTGLEVNDPEALVRFPVGMLEEALKTAPAEVVLCGQDPECETLSWRAHVSIWAPAARL